MNQLAVIGSGSWGTALAIALAPRFDRLTLWARRAELAHEWLERLVGHDQGRAGGQGAGQADALALPAGQLARVAVELAHGQPGLLGQLPDLAAALLAGQAALGPQRLLDDAGQRHPRVERGVRVLEHHLHVVAGGPALRPAHRAQRGAAQPHLALGGLLQPDDHPAQGGLAAARLAHDAQRAARGDLQADAGHRLDRRARPGQQAAGPVVLGHVDQAEQRGWRCWRGGFGGHRGASVTRESSAWLAGW